MTNIGIQVGSLLTGTASFFTCSVLIRFLSSGRPACPPARLVCRVFFSVFVFVRPSSAFACSTHPAVDESVCCMHAVMLRCGLFSKRLRNRLGALRFRTCENCRLSKRTIEDSAPPRKHYMQQGMVHLSQQQRAPRMAGSQHKLFQTNQTNHTTMNEQQPTTTTLPKLTHSHTHHHHTANSNCNEIKQTHTPFLTLQQTKNKHSDNQLPKLQQTPTKNKTNSQTRQTQSSTLTDNNTTHSFLSFFSLSLSFFLLSFLFSFAKLHHSTPTANNKQLTHSLTHSRTHACTHSLSAVSCSDCCETVTTPSLPPLTQLTHSPTHPNLQTQSVGGGWASERPQRASG